MGIIYQKDKKTGTTYVYDNEAYWDSEKQQSRARRKLIGKLDPETGQVVPTRSYQRKPAADQANVLKPGPAAVTSVRRSFYGASYLLDEIGRVTGLSEDLRLCFPERYQQIQSIAYYLILEDSNPLSRFPHWSRLHVHPYGEDISSQRSSELFQSITEEERLAFFRRQGKRRLGNEYWTYDITSISSYSDVLTQVKQGRNKEHDRLPQINLALLFGGELSLPFYYRKLPDNITDVTTVKWLMAEFDVMGYQKVNVLLDRGFYSRENINALYKNHQKFIIRVKLSLRYVREVLDEERESLKLWSNYQPQFGVYGICRRITWDYEQVRPYKGAVLKGPRRAYLYLFYNPDKAASDEMRMNTYLTALDQDLAEGTCKAYRMTDYETYFEVKTTPKRGRQIQPREEAMREASQNYGYYALLSNEVKEPFDALSLYRSKDIVEKGFGNLKERLHFRRMHVSSELTLDGKLFVEFVALIYLSALKKSMQDAGLFDQWTLQGLLDELDSIERFEVPGHGRLLGEVTKKQAGIYQALGLEPPSL